MRKILWVITAVFLALQCRAQEQVSNNSTQKCVELFFEQGISAVVVEDVTDGITRNFGYGIFTNAFATGTDLSTLWKPLPGRFRICTLIFVNGPSEALPVVETIPGGSVVIVNVNALLSPTSNPSGSLWKVRKEAVYQTGLLLKVPECPFPLCAMHVAQPDEPDQPVRDLCPPCEIKMLQSRGPAAPGTSAPMLPPPSLSNPTPTTKE